MLLLFYIGKYALQFNACPLVSSNFTEFNIYPKCNNLTNWYLTGQDI